MAADIIDGICTFVSANAYGGIGCTVWDGELARYDAGQKTVGPESSAGRSGWPGIKFSMPVSGFSRTETFEEPYYDEGLVVCQVWDVSRAGAMGTGDMIEVLVGNTDAWTSIGALIPSPYRNNPHLVVQLLIAHWTCYQVEGARTQKVELVYTWEGYFKCILHGALPLLRSAY